MSGNLKKGKDRPLRNRSTNDTNATNFAPLDDLEFKIKEAKQKYEAKRKEFYNNRKQEETNNESI